MTRTISFSSATAIAAPVLGASAFLDRAAAAAGGNYCLSSDSIMDCGFTSLAQRQAMASGGLSECNMVVAGSVFARPLHTPGFAGRMKRSAAP